MQISNENYYFGNMAERKSSVRNETIIRRVRVKENNMYITIYIASVVCATNMKRAINTNRNLISNKFVALMSLSFPNKTRRIREILDCGVEETKTINICNNSRFSKQFDLIYNSIYRNIWPSTVHRPCAISNETTDKFIFANVNV